VEQCPELGFASPVAWCGLIRLVECQQCTTALLVWSEQAHAYPNAQEICKFLSCRGEGDVVIQYVPRGTFSPVELQSHCWDRTWGGEVENTDLLTNRDA